VDSIQVAKNRVLLLEGFCETGNEPLSSMKTVYFKPS
jgi:hypothetical protein